ncbi:hypothetical protein AB4Y40_16305 [Paraburkholderia sp. EG287B]|uniref:hypothetical protein n=1 Tax=Paraburkholderia sp. EG287B TaxID=3237010 RepID=UPI0034D17363
MGVAFGLAAALEEPIKITQAIGFANKRQRRRGRGWRTLSRQGARVDIDSAAWHDMRQMRAPDHSIFSYLIIVNSLWPKNDCRVNRLLKSRISTGPEFTKK